MTSPFVRSIGTLIGVLAQPMGCGGDGGSSEGGSGGATVVGVSGGSSGLGGAGVGVGGAGSAVGGGPADYWPAAYDPTGTPVFADGSYYHANDVWPAPGACMTCHSGMFQPTLAFGGTVFRSDGVTPAANVEVGVRDGVNQYFVYSTASGAYWAEGPNAVNWTAADIRMRNSTAEVPKTAVMERGADCDSCHIGAELLTIAP